MINLHISFSNMGLSRSKAIFFSYSYFAEPILKEKKTVTLGPVYMMPDPFGTSTKKVLIFVAFPRDLSSSHWFEIRFESGLGLDLHRIQTRPDQCKCLEPIQKDPLLSAWGLKGTLHIMKSIGVINFGTPSLADKGKF